MDLIIPNTVLLDRIEELEKDRKQALEAIAALEQEQAKIASTFVKNPAKWSNEMEAAGVEYHRLEQLIKPARSAYLAAEQRRGNMQKLEWHYMSFKLAEEWIKAALIAANARIDFLARCATAYENTEATKRHIRVMREKVASATTGLDRAKKCYDKITHELAPRKYR